MKFIKLKERIVSVDSIIKIEQPVPSGVNWQIRTVLDTAKTQEPVMFSMYNTEDEAKNEYSRIVEQLCSNK